MPNLFTVTPLKYPYSMSKIKAGFNYLEFESTDEMELLYNILTRSTDSTFRGIDCNSESSHYIENIALLLGDESKLISEWNQVAMKNFHLTTEREMILNRFKRLYPSVNWIFLSCKESHKPKFSRPSIEDERTDRLLESLVEHGLIRKFRITNELMEQVNKLSGL